MLPWCAPGPTADQSIRCKLDTGGPCQSGGTARRPFAAQLGGRPDGTHRIVLARDRQAENGGYALLIGAADDTPVTLDRPADDRLGTASMHFEDLRVGAVDGRPNRVGAEDCDYPAPALRRGLGTALRSTAALTGGHIVAYQVHEPSAYGVVEFDDAGKVASMEEQPERPKSS